MSRQKTIISILVCFLLLNLAGLIVGLGMWRNHLEGLSPHPELVAGNDSGHGLTGTEPIQWTWSQPVVMDEFVGTAIEPAPVEFLPSVNGDFRWINDRTLEFQPLEAWPSATRVRWELSVLATNQLGRVFALKEMGQVQGPALDLISSESFQEQDLKQLFVRLRFNAPVKLEDLKRHLHVRFDSGDAGEFHLRETPMPDEFLLSISGAPGNRATLVLDAGLPGLSSEGLPLRDTKKIRLKAFPGITLTGVDLEQPTFGPGEIELSFSSPPDLRSLSDALTIEPSVQASIGKGKWWRRNNASVTGDFEPGVRYTLRIGPGFKGINGEPLPSSVEKAVVFPARQPGLKFAHEGLILNATGARQIEVHTRNEGELELSLYRVHDNNLVEYALHAAGKDGWQNQQSPTEGLGAPIWKSKQAAIGDVVALDLAEALASSGQGVYRLRVVGKNSKQTLERLVLVGETGLLARRHGDKLLVWASRLDSAEPSSEMEVTLWSDTRQNLASGMTDAQGLAVLEIPDDPSKGAQFLLLARSVDRVALLTLDQPRAFPTESPARKYLTSGYEAFVHTDRGMFRPGETVNARAVIRGPGFAVPGAFPLEWTLRDASGLKLWSTPTTAGDVGTALASFELDQAWPNGAYILSIGLPGDDAPAFGSTTIRLESFVPPQVVVEADTPDGEGSVPERFKVNVDARMLYGGPAARHEVKASLTLSPEIFRSSEYPEHSFSDVRKEPPGPKTVPVATFHTDADGRGTFVVDVPDDVDTPSALRAVIGVTVKEFSGRAATTFLSRRVDRDPWYAGIRLETDDEGNLEVDLAGVTPDGNLIGDSPEMRLEWFRLNRQRGYRRNADGGFSYVSEEIALKEGERKTTLHGGRTAAKLKVAPNAVYRVVATDPATGLAAARDIRVGGASGAPERADRVALELDRESYKPGDEAVLSVHAPFAGALLLTVEGDRLLMQKVVGLAERLQSVRFTVPESGVPNLWVRATVLRPQPDRGAQPVLRSEGALALRLDHPGLRKPPGLDVAEQLIPGEAVRLTLSGEPGAEVVVAGVDEGILLLDDFQTPAPAEWFLALRRAASTGWDLFDNLLPELGVLRRDGDPEMGGGAGMALGMRLNPVDAKRFEPFSWWSGAHRIGEDGRLELDMTLPEFTGRIRWMASQVSREGMGHAEAYSQSGRPLVAQQSLPLFLAPGDETQWTVRLHNRSDAAMRVRVSPETEGPVEALGEAVEFELAPGEVRLHTLGLRAGSEIGVAACSLRIEVGETAWTDRIELGVRPVEAFTRVAERKVLMPGETLRFDPLDAMVPGTGKREMRAASIPALQLGGAREFLLRYPYGCVEQTVSKAMPALFLPEIDAAAKDGADEMVRVAVQRLWRMQRQDGSFGYWSASSDRSVPGSFGALVFLLEAKARGHEVDDRFLRLGLDWTRDWLNGGAWNGDRASSPVNRDRVQACLVLALAGELDAGWAQRLRDRREDLDAASRIRAAEALAVVGHRPLAGEMLAGVERVDRDGWGWFSATSENADLLRVLLMIDPTDGRIPELIDSLLEARRPDGAWRHTYENASALRALASAAKAFPGGDEPMRVVWSRGKMEDGRDFSLDPEEPVTLVNHGNRPVYLEQRVSGVPVHPPAFENRFRLEGRLLRPDGREIGPGEAVEGGEVLLLHLRVRGLPRGTEHLVIDQRLPAGLEPLPPATQRNPKPHVRFDPGFRLTSANHIEVRDDRLLVFPGNLRDGDLLLVVRAVSPGTYRFPAAYAEDMYDPELRARGRETRLEVRP